MKSIVFLVKSTIYGHGMGWCFTPKDFYALDSQVAVRKALSRLDAEGFIKRIGWGIYEYPRMHKILGQLPPDITEVAKALMRASKTKMLPSGAYAANLLGLTEQVPGKIVYLTDGPSRKIKIGKTELILKHTTVKNMLAANSIAGIVIQALRYLGKAHIDNVLIDKIRRQLSLQELKSLDQYGKLAPYWVRLVIAQIVEK